MHDKFPSSRDFLTAFSTQFSNSRLAAIDGSQFSVTNTPAILSSLSKAASRRMKAAFAKVGVAVLVELGIHNPLAAEIGQNGESEMVLSWRLLERLPAKALLICDRYYGVNTIVAQSRVEAAAEAGCEVVRISFGKTLVMVRSLWLVLAAGNGLIRSEQASALTGRVMALLVPMRSCPKDESDPVHVRSASPSVAGPD